MLTLHDHLRAIVYQAIGLLPGSPALVVFDTQSALARQLTEGYRAVLPQAVFLDFAGITADEIRDHINGLAPRALVVLIQSTSFRLNEFRFRLELFERQLAVIEHPHLGRMDGEEHATYIDGLAYDPSYYRTLGPALKQRIDRAEQVVVRSPAAELVYTSRFESAKLNIGDYTGMKNIGGQFPIGEVFTEPVDFAGVNGTVKLFAFGGEGFRVVAPPEPVTVVIEKGIIVDAPGAPDSFRAVLDTIAKDEPLWIRELGFGMNRAFTRERRVSDIGSYERMCGIHLSIGQKHTIYAKPGMPKRTSRYHVDVFVDVVDVTIDGEVVYREGDYCI